MMRRGISSNIIHNTSNDNIIRTSMHLSCCNRRRCCCRSSRSSKSPVLPLRSSSSSRSEGKHGSHHQLHLLSRSVLGIGLVYLVCYCYSSAELVDYIGLNSCAGGRMINKMLRVGIVAIAP